MERLNFFWYYKQIETAVNKCDPSVLKNPLELQLNSVAQSKYDYDMADVSMLETLSYEEKIIALMSLSRYIAPELNGIFSILTVLHVQLSYLSSRPVSEIKSSAPFIPTVETACFLLYLLTGKDKLNIVRTCFHPQAPLFTNRILQSLEDDPMLNSPALECTPEFIYKTTTGENYLYGFSSDFPATPVIPRQSWEDLVLPHSVTRKIEDLKFHIRYHQQLLEHPNMGRRFKENVLALFSGDPGTGKTLTAGLLGKELDMPVYRIDLSRIVSKWVGETTKNLRHLFDVAEDKNWILFFDEADSVFGKRSKGTGDASDQYHNQNISYLLQRIDNYKGFVILATNLGINIDDAFRRRIDMEITFMPPDRETRIALWEKAFSDAGLTFSDRPAKRLARQEMRAGDWNTPDEGISLEEIGEYWERATGAKVNKVMKRLLIESMIHHTKKLPSGVIVKAIQEELGLRKI